MPDCERSTAGKSLLSANFRSNTNSHISGTFEFLKDNFIHPASGINQCSCNDFKLPPPSRFRADPKKRRGNSNARLPTPPLKVLPRFVSCRFDARPNLVMESKSKKTSRPLSAWLRARSNVNARPIGGKKKHRARNQAEKRHEMFACFWISYKFRTSSKSAEQIAAKLEHGGVGSRRPLIFPRF